MTGRRTLALCGTVGGTGTTTLAAESGAVLARAGYDVAILDAAFATQGLSRYVHGRIDTDLTAVVADGDADLDEALYPIATDLPGSLVAAPAHAPFERLARAKTAGAAERFERQVAAATLAHDVVLVDTPPIAANQAVAAVNACERVAVVTPDTVRGADGLACTRGRLQDVGVGVDAIAATFTSEASVVEEATTAIPRHDATTSADRLVAVRGDTELARAVARFSETVLGLDVDVTFEEGGRLDRLLPGRR